MQFKSYARPTRSIYVECAPVPAQASWSNAAHRTYGVLRENIYDVLWIDRDHEMYPSVKKHT